MEITKKRKLSIDDKETTSWNDHFQNKPSLELINLMIKEMSSTLSNDSKKEILLKYKNCIRILYYTSNPFFHFHLSSIRISKTMPQMDKWKSIESPNDI